MSAADFRLEKEIYTASEAAAELRERAVKGVGNLRGGKYAHEVAHIDALVAISYDLEALRLEIRRTNP